MREPTADAPKILIIDDNPAIVDIIKHAILMHGKYQPVVAYDGAEGLEKFYAEAPVCVIIDAKMPKLDGFQLLRCLRGDGASAQAAMIMLTALVRREDQLAGELSGADVYLTKPFKPSELLQAIERAVQVTPAERLARQQDILQEPFMQ